MREVRRDGTVLIAAPGWHDDRPGGANKLPTDFARFLAARGHDVTYLCPADVVDRVAIDRIDGVSVRRYPAPTSPSPSVRNVRQHWRLSRAIASDVSRERPVRALLGHTPIQYLAAARALDAGVRRCYGVHSPFEAELREGAIGTPTMKQRVAWRGAAWIEERLLGISDLVHYDSQVHRRIHGSPLSARHAEARASSCPAGWMMRGSGPRACRATICAAASARPGSRACRRSSRCGGWCRAWGSRRSSMRSHCLTARGRAFRVVIGGDGPRRPALEAQVSAAGLRDRVSFLGRIPERDLVDSFAAADCFVLPTRALECFGLIVLESYACGVPVVGVPVGAIPEVIGPEFAAWIASDNSATAIAERMDDVLSGRLTADPRAHARLGRDVQRLNVVAERHERVLLGGLPRGGRACRLLMTR